MDLIKKVLQDGAIIGVQVQDNDISYYAVIEALKTQAMLDALKESNWLLSGLPNDFRQNGKKIEDLPSINYSAIPEADKYDFYAFDGEILSDAELTKILPEIPVTTIPWRAPIYSIIKTREALLTFLRERSWRNSSNISSPTNYLPLNAFVNPEALFTPEEYASLEFKEYTRLIEERRRMQYVVYRELVDVFTSMGMPRNYTAMDFQVFYFSWGICGIRDDRLSQNTLESLSRLGQLRMGGEAEGFTISKEVLLTSSGTTIPPIEPGWKMRSDGPDYRDLAENEVAIAHLYKESMDLIENVVCSHMRVKYNQTSMFIFIDTTGQILRVSTATPYYPFSYTQLPADMYNVFDRSIQEDILNRMMAESMTTRFISMLTEQSDASTLKALTSIGMTENAAINFIAARMAEATPTDGGEGGIDSEESGRMKVILAGISSYLSGNDDAAEFAEDIQAGKLDSMPTDTDPMNDVADFVSDCREGSINLDQTQMGASLDSKNNAVRINQIFSLALRYLGCTRKSLYDQVSGIKIPEDACYVNLFGDSDMYIKIPVVRGHLKIKGYEKDVGGYMIEAAKTSMLWINITTAYTESTFKGPARHVGVSYQVMNHCNRSKNGMTIKYAAVENYFTELAMTAINQLPTQEKRSDARSKIDAYVCRLIFSTYNAPSSSVQLPESLGGGVVQVSDEIANYVRNGKIIQDRYESLFGLCDMMAERGKFLIFCNNARISPNLVIPYKGEKIVERPFLPNWIDTRKDPLRRQSMANAGIIPDETFCGILRLYPSMHGIDHVDQSKKDLEFSRGNINYESECYHTAPYSLLRYYDLCMDMRNKAMVTKDHQLANISTLEETMYPRFFEEPELVPCTEAEFVSNFTHSTPRMLTKELVSTEFPAVVNAAQVNYVDTDNTPVGSTGFKDITAIPAEVLKDLSADFITNMCVDLSSRIAMHFHFGDLLVFKDGHKFMFSDIAQQDLSNYAVEYFNGVYFILNSSGSLTVRYATNGVIN